VSRKRKTYSPDFKAKVVLELLEGDQTINEIASKYEILPKTLIEWKKHVFKRAYFKKEKIYIFLYGMVFAGLIISCAAEDFFIALSYWLQAIIFLYIIYKLPNLLIKPLKEKVEGKD
jgi:putative transposase